MPCDYEHSLWDEIRSRTQGEDEKVAFYISAMQNLFNRLPHIVEETTKLDIIQRNLLPCYKKTLALSVVENIAHLIKLCRTLEDANERASKFKPPPTNTSVLLEPNLAYRKNRQRHFVHAMSCGGNSSGNVSVVELESVCWNCRLPGLLARFCKTPPTKHCFRCGAKNVTIRTCTKCSGNGPVRH